MGIQPMKAKNLQVQLEENFCSLQIQRELDSSFDTRKVFLVQIYTIRIFPRTIATELIMSGETVKRA